MGVMLAEQELLALVTDYVYEVVDEIRADPTGTMEGRMGAAATREPEPEGESTSGTERGSRHRTRKMAH